MNLTLEVDLVSLRVVTGRDVHGRHVETLVGLPDGLHVAEEVRVFHGHTLVPHHRGVIVVL